MKKNNLVKILVMSLLCGSLSACSLGELLDDKSSQQTQETNQTDNGNEQNTGGEQQGNENNQGGETNQGGESGNNGGESGNQGGETGNTGNEGGETGGETNQGGESGGDNNQTSNNEFNAFKTILSNLDSSVDLMNGFGLSKESNETKKPAKRNVGHQVDESFNPDEYGVHYLEEEGDWNIYSSIVRLQKTLDPFVEEWQALINVIEQNATELGEFTHEGTTYELSMFDEHTGVISYLDSEPVNFQSQIYSYEEGRWNLTTLATWESTLYELFFEENELTFHIKAQNVTKLEVYNNYSLITPEYFDKYINVVKDENGDYVSVKAILPNASQDEIYRTYYEMYRRDGVVNYLTSEEMPSWDMIDTSFISFRGDLSISYNLRTYPNDVVSDENYRSWAFLQNKHQYFWTLQVCTGTTDGLKVFPEFRVDSISPRVTNTIDKVYYPYDWFDAYFDENHVPSYPAPDWLTSFVGMPMRAVETSNGTFDAVQDNIVYVDSLGMAGNDGSIIPGRGELSALYFNEDFDRKLYDFWSDRISELGLSFNEEDYGQFMDFLKEYSRADLFNPEKMNGLCDVEYVKAHLQSILTDYERVFEPSLIIKYQKNA